MSAFERSEMLLGSQTMKSLAKIRVAVFGIGGVGGYVVEALARSGVGAFVLIDHDTVAESNINRQIIATYDTIGRYKVDVMKERIHSIQKDAQVTCVKMFYLPETEAEIDLSDVDYIVDAMDTVTAKIALILRAKERNIPIISCMGTGNKLDPGRFEITDIEKTKVCPLAKVMRHELKKRGITGVKVLYSSENPLPLQVDSVRSEEDASDAQSSSMGSRRSIPGSVAFVPSVAGLMIAGEIIRMIKQELEK